MDLETALAAEEAQRESGIGLWKHKATEARAEEIPWKPHQWYPFWESFEYAVHKNPYLSGVDKFNYLKSVLVGTAQNVVAGLTLTSVNYEKAVELLQARFGNRKIVIFSHVETLTRISKIMSISEVEKLRSLYDSVVTCARFGKYGDFS